MTDGLQRPRVSVKNVSHAVSFCRFTFEKRNRKHTTFLAVYPTELNGAKIVHLCMSQNEVRRIEELL